MQAGIKHLAKQKRTSWSQIFVNKALLGEVIQMMCSHFVVAGSLIEQTDVLGA